MPIQLAKRYSIIVPFKGKPEIEYYVDKYVHAFILAKTLKGVGHKVRILDNKTQKVYKV